MLRHAELGGVRGVFVPVAECVAVARIVEWACDVEGGRAGGGWRPRPEVVEVLRMLRLAPIVADLATAETSADGSAGRGRCDDRLMTTTGAARVLEVTPRRVRQLAAAGRFPGAHRAGGVWLIPRDEVQT